MRTLSNLAAALAAALVLTACETAEKGPASQPAAAPAMGVLNDTCPIMGGEWDGKTVKEYKGERVGFCCGDCVKTWNEWTDAKKAEYLAKHHK